MKPSTPKGTRDFSPTEMVRRNYIFDTIRTVFQRYGYLPIETPAMENMETLMGKYGEEGDRLIFKILDSGDSYEKYRSTFASLDEDVENELIASMDKEKHGELTSEEIKRKSILQNRLFVKSISEKALRYDLTVPFARYVVQHQNEIVFPFKRYQMQPVWRADRPQKGRYREFYQCDADVIGSNSLLNEVELVQLIDEVFTKLDIPVTIKLNNRKVLQGVAEYCGCPDKLMDITVAIDKLDKVGRENVVNELKEKGIPKDKIQTILSCVFPEPEDYVYYTRENLLDRGYDNVMIEEEMKLQDSVYRQDLGKINCLHYNFWGSLDKKISDIGTKGCHELIHVFEKFLNIKLKTAKLEFDPTLARGLNYYTGAIFEIKANEGTLTSSICGGGRYDDLTGIFGLPNVSGVGISFGIDRIFDVLTELNKFDKIDYSKFTTKLMFAHFAEAEQAYCLPLLSMVRAAGINAELYPDVVKIKKQFDYANKKQIPFVVVVGGDEMQSGLLTFKNMQSGEQEKLTIGQVIERLK